MSTLITGLFAALGRKAAFWAAVAVAICAALWIAWRRGRHEAEAAFIIRRADARIRSMQTAREARHEVRNADRADLDRRAERWMRD